MKTFSIQEALSVAWTKLWSNFSLILVLLVINLAVSIFFGIIQNALEHDPVLPKLTMTISSLIINVVMSIGMTKIYFKIYDGIPAGVNDLFAHARLFWSFLFNAIVSNILILLGLVFLIIPGIYLALRFTFSSFLVVDKEIGTFDALKESGKLTAGVKGQLILFFLVLMGINMLGILALVIGLVVTVPLSVLAYVHVYRTLLKTEALQVTPVSPTSTQTL